MEKLQKQKEITKRIDRLKEELKTLDGCYGDITTMENQLLEVRKNLLEKAGELDTYVQRPQLCALEQTNE